MKYFGYKQIVTLLLFLCAVVFWNQIISSPLVLAKFALFLFLFLFVPGQMILGLARVRMTFLESVTCSLIIGMAASTTVLWVLGLFHQVRWVLLWLGLSIAVWGMQMLKRGVSGFSLPTFRIRWSILALPAIYLLTISILFFTGYFDSVKKQPDGGLIVSSYPEDGLFHAAITHELTNGIPPETPLMAGITLNYSCFMDLLASAAHRGFNLDVLDLIYRLFPLFWFGLLVLSVFVCARYFSGSHWAGVLCCFLVILGGGIFNIVPGLLLLRHNQSWELAFHSSTMVPLYFVNPMVPAVPVFFTGLFCLTKSFRTSSKTWLFIAGLVFGVLTEYKLFGTLLVLGGLFMSGIFQAFQSRTFSLLKASLIVLIMSLPFLIYHAVENVDAARFVLRIQFGSFIIWSLDYSRLDWLSSEMRGLLHEYRPTIERLLWVSLILPIYIIGGLGIRVVAIPDMLRQFRFSRRVDPMRIFLSCSFLCGLLLSFTFSIAPADMAQGYNNSIWFYAFALLVATLIASERIVVFLRKGRPLFRGGLLAILLLLCAPSSVQFFSYARSLPMAASISGPELMAADFLRENTEPGAVILKDPGPRVAGKTFLIPAIAGRRVVLSSSYITKYQASLQTVRQRTRDIENFLRDPASNGQVLERYKVDYVWVDTQKESPKWGEAVLCTGEKLGKSESATHILTRVYDGEGLFSIYRVARIGEDARMEDKNVGNVQKCLHGLKVD